MTTKLLVTAVVAAVIIIEGSQENLAIIPVLILVQILAQDIIITTLLKTTLHIMIVIDLDMTNITKTPHVHIILLALIIIQPQLVVQLNLTLFFVNAPLAITIPLLDAINHHTALLLNHIPIAIEADLTLCQEFIQLSNTNLLSILLNNQFSIVITLPPQEKNMYHPNNSSCFRRSNNLANAITPSTWFINLYFLHHLKKPLYLQN